MSLLVGVDVGTTNTKAVLYDPARGKVLATASRPTITHHPRLGWSEFDPAEVWRGVAEAVREIAAACAPGAVAAIAVASMGEAGVPVGARGDYLYPIIAWYDPRTEPFARWWAGNFDQRRLYEITGLAPRHIYGLNKLLWLRRRRPAVYRALRHWLSMEDFVLWKLTGRFATDYSIASRTMAFDQRKCHWSAEVLATADVPVDIWPEALPSGTVVGPLTPAAAAETGLGVATQAVTGGHDHLCAALAAGLLAPGTVLDSTGTAQAVLAVTGDYQPSDRLRTAGLSLYHYVARGRYVVQAGLSAAGGSLAWLASLLGGAEGEGGAERYETLLAEAAAVPPGSRGLLWLPHLLGSGSPENDPDSRGALLVRTTSHTRGDLVRSLLEALCYSLRQNVDLLQEATRQDVKELIAVGGATKSPLWLQLKADIVERPVRVPLVSEATALGAALLAGLGAGVFADENAAVASLAVPATTYLPDAAHATLYAALYRELYLPLYPLLQQLSHKLAALELKGHSGSRKDL